MNAPVDRNSFWETGIPPRLPNLSPLPEDSTKEALTEHYETQLRLCRNRNLTLETMVWARDHRFNELAGFLKDKAPDLFDKYFRSSPPGQVTSQNNRD